MQKKFTEQEIADFLSEKLKELEPIILEEFQNSIVFGKIYIGYEIVQDENNGNL